jgi:FlaA1/EpsC-like NDP-sugar epimerase
MDTVRSILVTGGTGTFGRAFVNRVLKSNVERVCVLSRGEHAQADMREQIKDDRVRFFIGDVRDRNRLRRAFHDVEVVVHAAALKRIEVAEYNPNEICLTNVMGTVNVIEAATDAGVTKVIGISSDKACAPVNAYGASKLLAEKLFLAANNARGERGPIFSVCRYGNVWGSNGSVAPKWKSMIESGVSELPVTDPECSRFFMLIEEAADLVLDMIKTMKGGELVVPDLPAYRLGDLVEAMGCGMTVTGLPEWEKRHESMMEGQSSEGARRMSVNELRGALEAL